MPVIMERPIETVRWIKVQIGEEFIAIDFGRPVLRARAIERAREALESMAEPTPSEERDRDGHV